MRVFELKCSYVIGMAMVLQEVKVVKLQEELYMVEGWFTFLNCQTDQDMP
jgi:hypothetical protein